MKHVTITDEFNQEVVVEISQEVWEGIKSLNMELRKTRDELDRVADDATEIEVLANTRKIITQKGEILKFLAQFNQGSSLDNEHANNELDLDGARCEILARISRLRERG